MRPTHPSVGSRAKSAEISYRKLAKGPISATGTLASAKDKLLATLDAEGRVEFPVEVSLENGEGTEVASVTVHWHVRKNAS